MVASRHHSPRPRSPLLQSSPRSRLNLLSTTRPSPTLACSALRRSREERAEEGDILRAAEGSEASARCAYPSAWDGAGSDDRWASVSCATTEGFKGGTERDEGCDAQAGLMRVRRRSLGGALRRHTGAIDPRHVPSLCNSTQSESNIMTSCRKIGCALALTRWASSLDITEPTRRHARLQTASWSKG